MDNDEIILEDAAASVFSLDKAYRRLIMRPDLAGATQLKPKLEEAMNAYSRARANLLAAGTISSDDDVKEMRRIRAEIDQAANIQSLIAGAAKLVGFLIKFA